MSVNQGAGVPWEQVRDAVEDQRRMVARRLARYDRAGDVDLVLGEVLSQAWESIERGRWDKAGRPALGAWVSGVASLAVHEWARGTDRTKKHLGAGRRSGAPPVEVVGPDVSELPVEVLTSGVDGRAMNAHDPLRAALGHLHQLVLATTPDARVWTRIIHAASAASTQTEAALREEIRVFVTAYAHDDDAPPVGPTLARYIDSTTHDQAGAE